MWKEDFFFCFSDQGLPGNQLQLATGAGNATNSNWTIETGKWVHIAFTYNGNTGRSEMFVDGVSRGYGNKTLRTTVNWGYFIRWKMKQSLNAVSGLVILMKLLVIWMVIFVNAVFGTVF